MALKIKAGSVINYYGGDAKPFDQNSSLSQEALAHLKGLYPDAIEDDAATGSVDVEKLTVVQLKEVLTAKAISFGPNAVKAELVELLKKSSVT